VSAGKQGPVTIFAFKPYALALLSMTQEQVGDHAAALETIAEALAASAESGARWWDAEIHRLKGMVLLSRHDLEASEACFVHSKKSRNDKMRDPSSCAPPLASRASGAIKAKRSKLANCLLRFTGGSQKGLTRAI
jgi:hypothetical protein